MTPEKAKLKAIEEVMKVDTNLNVVVVLNFKKGDYTIENHEKLSNVANEIKLGKKKKFGNFDY